MNAFRNAPVLLFHGILLKNGFDVCRLFPANELT